MSSPTSINSQPGNLLSSADLTANGSWLGGAWPKHKIDAGRRQVSNNTFLIIIAQTRNMIGSLTTGGNSDIEHSLHATHVLLAILPTPGNPEKVSAMIQDEPPTSCPAFAAKMFFAQRRKYANSEAYSSRKSRPLISAGLSMPSSPRIVGATSSSAPPSRKRMPRAASSIK